MTTFAEALTYIEKEVQEAIAKYIKDAGLETLPEGQLLGGKGEQSFTLPLDSSGKGKNSYSEAAYGSTLDCTAWVTNPADTSCSGDVTSTGGGGGKFKDKKKGDKFHFKLKTNYVGKTTFTLELTATPVPSPRKVDVTMRYTY